MRKLFKSALLVGAAVVVATAAQAASAGTNVGFNVVNKNEDHSIQNVWYALASEDDPWHAADVVSAVGPGTTSTFHGLSGPNCLYDVKIQFSDGYVETFDNVNVCRYDSVDAT